MRSVEIYNYKSDYGYIKTPINLGIDNPKISFRLVADEGKILTNGADRKIMVEIPKSEISLWVEVEKTIEEKEQEEQDAISNIINVKKVTNDGTDYKELLDIITGNEG